MKILVLGARGMLGSMLLKVLQDHDATAWDRDDIDITHEAQVQQKLLALAPDVIINAAAYTDVDGAETSEKNKEAAFQVNEGGVRHLVRAAAALSARLVHYSTDYVFKGTSESGYAESDRPGPAVNVYGESKLAGEQVLLTSQAKGYLIRTAWLYGPNGKNFVATMLALGRTRDEIKVVDDQRGCPTFTKDVGEFTKALLEKDYDPGIYHAVNMGVASWYELAQEIFALAGMDVRVTPVSSQEFPRPAERPKYSVLRNTRGPKMRQWQEALREYIEMYYTKAL